MDAYRYDRETKEYIGKTVLQESPLEPGVFFEQENVTTVPPPFLQDKPETQTAIFLDTEENWKVVCDFRGCESYDNSGKRTQIENLDEEIRIKPPTNFLKVEWDEKEGWKEAATEEELLLFETSHINQEAIQFLEQTDWKVIRHRDQVELGAQTSLSETDFKALLVERQMQRDIVVKI